MVVVPEHKPLTVVPTSTINWSADTRLNPPLVLDVNRPLVRIPKEYVEGTRIGFAREDVILYFRKPIIKQLCVIKTCSAENVATTWITGAPGTGESCAALALASSVDRVEWDVVWVHLATKHPKVVNCVWLGRNLKRVGVIEPHMAGSALKGFLTSVTRRTIVFLDGYIGESFAEEVLGTCLTWQSMNPDDRRVICITSMVGSVQVAPDAARITASASPRNNPTLRASLPNDSDFEEDMRMQMLIQLMSWRFEEYVTPVEHEEFFDYVKDKLVSKEAPVKVQGRNLADPSVLSDFKKSLLSVRFVSAKLPELVEAVKCEVEFQARVIFETSTIAIQDEQEWGPLDAVCLETDDGDTIAIRVYDVTQSAKKLVDSVIVSSDQDECSKASTLELNVEFVSPQERRRRLVESKFTVAGGCARVMFFYSFKEAVKLVDSWIRRVPDIRPYLKGAVGDISNGVVNSILSRYREEDDIRLVSSYAARAMTRSAGPEFVVRFAQYFRENPSMDDHLLKLWFSASLCNGGVSLWDLSPNNEWISTGAWEADGSVEIFYSTKLAIDIRVHHPCWMAPVKRSQSGYDAVFVDAEDNLVRFVQVARPVTRSFNPLEFSKLLIKLDFRI